MYYHVFIEDTDRSGHNRLNCVGSLNIEDIEKIASDYMENETFSLFGRVHKPSDISEIKIFGSEERFDKLVFPDNTPPLEIDTSRVLYLFKTEKIAGVSQVTDKFITSPPREGKPARTVSKSNGEKKQVFIGHGRDVKEALELQKYLKDELHIDARMFEDLKRVSGCKTIIELLEYFRDNVGYAFIIFTPDDYGCMCAELDKLATRLSWDKKKMKTEIIQDICGFLTKRARQNVIFELGLFIGALGRDNVCYLLHKDISDTPSNMDGVLHESFDKSVNETFTTVAEKLKKAKLAKA